MSFRKPFDELIWDEEAMVCGNEGEEFDWDIYDMDSESTTE